MAALLCTDLYTCWQRAQRGLPNRLIEVQALFTGEVIRKFGAAG
jgi:hypothetical protein